MAGRTWHVILLAGAGLLMGGCGTKITVTQYPVFWSDDLGVDSVAVWPFRNETGDANAGNIVADKLAAALASNGTYKTYNTADLKVMLDQADLQTFAGDDDTAAEAARKFGRAQAMITGTVTSYGTTTNRETRYRETPIYGYDQFGNYVVRDIKHTPYSFTRHDATAECTASLVRVSDGTVLHSTTRRGAWFAEGENPGVGPSQCVAQACDRMISAMVQDFAIVQVEIKVSKDALQVASERYDGKWRKAKEFSAESDEMFVVVTLPAEADRNRFRLVIVEKDGRTTLASEEVVWDRRDSGGRGYAFSPREIASNGCGPGKYTAKLYSGEVPVLTQDFSIK